jgi:hypothetical protein
LEKIILNSVFTTCIEAKLVLLKMTIEHGLRVKNELERFKIENFLENMIRCATINIYVLFNTFFEFISVARLLKIAE